MDSGKQRQTDARRADSPGCVQGWLFPSWRQAWIIPSDCSLRHYPQVAERFELIDNLVRCRNFLRDPDARKTVEDLMIYLEAKLRAMDTRLADRR
jgi:hypothetical protein